MNNWNCYFPAGHLRVGLCLALGFGWSQMNIKTPHFHDNFRGQSLYKMGHGMMDIIGGLCRLGR